MIRPAILWRRLLGPAISAAIMFAVLIGLGAWQVRRLHWKAGILQAIAQAEAAPAVPLPADPGRFQKVGVSGVLQPGAYLIYGADVRDTPQGPQMGGQLIQALQRSGGPPILVDRGWVPEHLDIGTVTPAGGISVAGYVRAPERRAAFVPHDDVAGRRVYTLDPPALAAALGLRQVAPFTLVALGRAAGDYPIPADTLPRPPNDHLSYAITWFGLAGVLVVIFALWARRAALAMPRSEAGDGRI